MSTTQTTRSGFSNTDVGLEDTSESFGLPSDRRFNVRIDIHRGTRRTESDLCQTIKEQIQ